MGVYEGDKPYLFISYSHKDQAEMEEVRDFLERNNVRYWYDNALQSGGVWGKEIAQKLKGSHSLLLLLSRNSADSNNVKNEITYAANYNKDVHIVMLEDFVLPDELELALIRYHRIMKNGREYEDMLLRSLPEELVGKEDDEVTDVIKDDTSNEMVLDPVEQCKIGYWYYYGINGYQKNYTEAVIWYRKAADQGNAVAQFKLGVCYDNGCGVNQDYTEAAKWYRKAADQGHARAQRNLGVCYEMGRGVNQDYAEALKWFTLAAEQGEKSACRNLSHCYTHDHGVPKDPAKAEYWLAKAKK